MPIKKSAKKNVRKNKRQKARNVDKKNVLKKTIKEYKKALLADNIEEATKKLPLVYKKLDKAAKTNVIKKNKASRLKSRLSKKLTPKK